MEGITSQTASVDYFQLLTVQLQHQDPVDPVDQEGLINDLTQFSILEGIENLNASFSQYMELQELTQGVNLIGKSVDYIDSASGEVRSGVATDVFNIDDSIQVLVDGQTVSLDQIARVTEAS
ncbi:flagellar basal body rod modification protein [Stieleria maiorica]|uniref:Basal-body rod modification protein FlgD n=1 Tax=Stieleria maiorica TaxID=2795974 RepID=A0A5B9MFP8_9BACT|nr:flagellar hook capping FlgD N-terminal domain-containing protein [Stieleria maiorica]QEF98850.1 flagellar basal body rod modification protein [Stieleria maiorica]